MDKWISIAVVLVLLLITAGYLESSKSAQSDNRAQDNNSKEVVLIISVLTQITVLLSFILTAVIP